MSGNDKKELLQIPAEIVKVESMRGGAVRLRVDSQEGVSDEVRGKIMSLSDKIGWFTFSSQKIAPEDVLNLPEIKVDSGKTPGQRLRAVLHVIWEHSDKKKTSDQFYQDYIERIIESLKQKYLE